MRIKSIFVLLFLVACSLKAFAQDYYVDITNRTGYTIMYMYISPGDSKSWEEDVLGDEVIIDGDARRVTLTGYNSPIFDIRLVDEDGDSYTFMAVDVTSYDIVVTIDDID